MSTAPVWTRVTRRMWRIDALDAPGSSNLSHMDRGKETRLYDWRRRALLDNAIQRRGIGLSFELLSVHLNSESGSAGGWQKLVIAMDSEYLALGITQRTEKWATNRWRAGASGRQEERLVAGSSWRELMCLLNMGLKSCCGRSRVSGIRWQMRENSHSQIHMQISDCT